MPLAVLVGIVLWWLLASRLPWSDRGLVVGIFAAAVAGTLLLIDPSLQGPALALFAPPIVASTWVGWLLLSFWLPWPARRAVLLLLLIAPGIGFCLVRVEGMTGSFSTPFHWRWSPTPEQKYLAELQASPAQQANVPPAALSEQPGDWPAFRGPRRDGRLLGVQIKTDWQKSPPQELWRHRIGPGWSSFAVIGDRLFTQEQRGEDEYVVCYDAANGKQVWAHHDDAIRFTEPMGGDGPRATPTFHAGRLYTQGAKGLLNCLDAASGKSLWSHNVVADCGAEVPHWAFASSPLVAHGLVVVFAGAPEGQNAGRLPRGNGRPGLDGGRWTGSRGSRPELLLAAVGDHRRRGADTVCH